MKLLRLKSEPRFYYILIGEEIFDFAVTVPGDLRLTMPLDANEFLPIICQMRKRGNLLERHQKRLEKIGPEELRPFRRPFPLEDLDLPVRPTSFRDFYAFEEHVRNARRHRGLDMIPEWYEAPAFYFSNTSCMLPHRAAVPKPAETEELDFELEVAAVVGMAGSNIPVEEADSYIAGFTILNDWSARDIQRREMKVGLGPAKGKDFATSIGPYLVTPDELEPRALPENGRGRRYDLTMKAFVNGQQISQGNLKEMHWTFAELIAHASRNTTLLPGDLIGSGTVGTGCLVEFPPGTYPWLRPGDVVRLEVDLLGTLENRIV